MSHEHGENSPRIFVMPETLANKIAAGEVVARPASALKELIENAIDADAQQIRVEIKGAGSQLIRVVDDGSGMGPDDAALCFARHATSKIRTAEELGQLHTLGFRGEALASIAAVAQVQLKTRRQQDDQGWSVRIHGGVIEESGPCAASEGTDLGVHNLFYNVPARRAFVKSPATEFSHITDRFLSQALAYPHVGFTLVNDGTPVYRLKPCAGTDHVRALRTRVGQIFGEGYARKLVSVQEETSYISVCGLVCRSGEMRRSRKERFLFVNDRVVKNAALRHAIMAAYEGLVPAKQYPFYVLFLSLDPRHVDANVHPAKTEVRFRNDRDVYAFLRAVIRKSVATADLVPQFSETQPTRHAGSTPRSIPSGDGRPPRPREPIADKGAVADALYAPRAVDVDEPAQPDAQLWQLHGRYICTSLRTGLMIFDQRAAHERILYEQARSTVEAGLGFSQQLLFTEPLTLEPNEMVLVEELMPELTALGFSIDRYSGRTIILRGVPPGMRAGSEKYLLQNILTDYRNDPDLSSLNPRDRLARSIARRGAMERETTLTPAEMKKLIDELFQCEDPYTSPGGQRIQLTITRDELKRRFRKRPSGARRGR